MYKIIIVILVIIVLVYFFTEGPQHESFVPLEILTNHKQLQKNIKLLKKVIDFLDSHELEYWVTAGTLLGAIRDKTMIQWDDDTDIAMKNEIINKLLLYENDLHKQNLGIAKWWGGYKIYLLDGENTGDNWKYPWVDIFTVIYDDVNNRYVYESEQARMYWPNEYFDKDIYPLIMQQFDDYYVKCPNNYMNFLNRAFPNWKNKGIVTYDHVKKQKYEKPIHFELSHYKDPFEKPYLWLYWDNIDGNTTPAYIDLCYETVVNKCKNTFEIVRLNKDNIKKYIPELSEYEQYMKNLIIAHKVDIYRIMLMYKYGGLYLDSDIIVLNDLSDINDKLKKFDFIGFGCTGATCFDGYSKPSNWAMASRPNSILMGRILQNIKQTITKKQSLDYHEIGKMVLWEELEKLANNDDYKYYHYPSTIDGTRDSDGAWVTNDRIFSNEPIKYTNDLLFFTVYNSGIGSNVKKLTREQILNKNWNFTKYINIGLN